MANIQSLIQLYNTCFIACIVIGAISLACAIFIFFKFDIKTNFAIRTGHAEKVAVNRFKGKNQKTDALQKQVNMDFTTGDLPAVSGKTHNQRSELTARLNEETAAAYADKMAAGHAPGGLAGTGQIGDFRFTITEDVVVIHTDEQI